MHKFNVWALTLAVGCTSAITMLAFSWLACLGCPKMKAAVTFMSNLYTGFAPTFMGGVVGAIWGFIVGAISGFLIAVFYNLFEKYTCCQCNKEKK